MVLVLIFLYYLNEMFCFIVALSDLMQDMETIDHICINSLFPSVLKINIGNPGNQVNYWGGLTPPLIYLATWISSIGFCVPGNQQINANMVNTCPTLAANSIRKSFLKYK